MEMLPLSTILLTSLLLTVIASGIDPQTCSCPEGLGYTYAEQNRATCGIAYFPSSTSDCLLSTPDGDIPGRILCSAPKGTAIPLFNCESDYRCLQTITRNGKEIRVHSMEGLMQVGGEFGCVRIMEEIHDVDDVCEQGELARCVFLGETINV
jgi:hypothetical protein